MAFSSPELWRGTDNAPSALALHTYVDPFIAMAWCGPKIGDTSVGVCVTDAIRRMPASLVQTAITLDHVVAGTVVLGLGAGEVANYRPYGWALPSAARRFEDATRQMRRFLDDPGPDSMGAIVAVRPPAGSPGPELWLAAHGPKGFALTGECADGWIPTLLDVPTWSAGRDAIRDSAVAHGRAREAVTLGLSLDVVVQDSHDAAVDLLDHPAVRQTCLLLPSSTFARYGAPHPLGGSAMSTLVATTAGPELLRAALAIPDALVRDQIIHGTVDEVAAQIKRYDGLEHLRLSDLSGVVKPGGGTERLLRVVEALRY